METKIFVQRDTEINPLEAIRFVSELRNVSLVAVYSSIKSESINQDYFDKLQKNLTAPFLAVKATGTITKDEGFLEDGVVFLIIHSKHKANIFNYQIDMENPVKTAESMIPELPDSGLLLTYSANYLRNLCAIDAILRRVKTEKPDLQIHGGASIPNPLVASNKGILKTGIVCAHLTDIEYSSKKYSGFRIDKENAKEFEITESDDLRIYKINGRNAVTEYSKIQHMQPYFINTFSKLLLKPEMANISKYIAGLNPVLYEAGIKYFIEFFGSETMDGRIDPMPVFEVDEAKRFLIIPNYKPKGTLLKKLCFTKETQIGVYDEIKKDFPKPKVMLINSCAYNQLWFDFAYDELIKRLEKLECPYIVYFTCGEFGTKTPHNPNESIAHGCITNAIAIKR